MSLDVFVTFYFTFYAMEQSGILDVKNPIHINSFYLVFTSRINTALTEFANVFNNRRLSTEHGWTPDQIWQKGILHEHNLLSSSGGGDESEVDEYCGEDSDASHPHSAWRSLILYFLRFM